MSWLKRICVFAGGRSHGGRWTKRGTLKPARPAPRRFRQKTDAIAALHNESGIKTPSPRAGKTAPRHAAPAASAERGDRYDGLPRDGRNPLCATLSAISAGGRSTALGSAAVTASGMLQLQCSTLRCRTAPYFIASKSLAMCYCRRRSLLLHAEALCDVARQGSNRDVLLNAELFAP